MADERILTTEEVERHRREAGSIDIDGPCAVVPMKDWLRILASHEALRADRDRLVVEREGLVQTVIEYLDNRPDDELGMKRQWDKFYPIARKLEQMLGVDEGRWG